MSASSHEIPGDSSYLSSPLAIDTFFARLSRTARVHVQQIAATIEQIAPTPGRVVFLHKTVLERRVNGLQPVVFSAIDATTFLQVAQVNLAMTSAAALTFVESASRSFPFPLSEIRSQKEYPFDNHLRRGQNRALSTLLGERGVVQTFVKNPQTDVLFSITARLLFEPLDECPSCLQPSLGLHDSLKRFLAFHNNFRFIPWLEGRTPIQKLRTFRSFQGVQSFDPTEQSEQIRADEC